MCCLLLCSSYMRLHYSPVMNEMKNYCNYTIELQKSEGEKAFSFALVMADCVLCESECEEKMCLSDVMSNKPLFIYLAVIVWSRVSELTKLEMKMMEEAHRSSITKKKTFSALSALSFPKIHHISTSSE